MTLFKQIMMFITALLSLVLTIVFSINFNVSKSFVQNDLYQRAKNSVNSLSLSLGNVSDDVFLMETTINAMFDGGHFQRITLKDTEDKQVYEKKEKLVIEGVPDFFIQFITLEAPVAKAVVSGGWNIFGSLEVQGHTGEACLRMWTIFKNLSLSFFILWGGCILISSLMLKLLLKSLDRIQEQAQAIGENKFIINPHIPSTVELKQVVIQMNKMVEKVQNNYNRSIETIKEAKLLRFKDRVSGLYNKAYFVRRIQANLESQEAVSKGEVVLLAVEGLSELKEAQGYGVSEAFVKKMAGILTDKTQGIEDCVVTCLKETEFGLIFPNLSPEKAMDMVASILKDAIKVIETGTVLNDYLNIFASLASYTYEDSSSGIFSKLDYSMTLAKNSQGHSPVHFREKTDTLLGRGEWKTLIERAIDKDKIVFSCQPVFAPEEQIFHSEIFIAMRDDRDKVKSAGFFMPMAMELGLARKIDQHVMTQAVRFLKDKMHKNAEDGFGVNVTADFIQDRGSFIWARNFLSAQKDLAAYLAFELSEAVLVRYPEISLDFAGLVRGMGFSFGIDNFTINDESLAMLQQLTPDYIKVDYAYLYDSRDQAKSKITLSMLQSITESLNIKLIGTKIETSNQLDDLKASGIQYFQGRQVAQIQPLERHDGY